MIDHVTIPVSNLVKRKIFYEKIFAPFNYKIIFGEEGNFWAFDFSQQLPNAIACKLAYKLFDVDNQLIMDFDYTYSLIMNETWQILFAQLETVRKY